MRKGVLVFPSKSNSSRRMRVYGQLSARKQKSALQAIPNSRLPSIKRLTTCISASHRFKMGIAFCSTISNSRAIPSDWIRSSIPSRCIPIRLPMWCMCRGMNCQKRFSSTRSLGNWLMSKSAQKPFQSETSAQDFIWPKSTLQVR